MFSNSNFTKRIDFSNSEIKPKEIDQNVENNNKRKRLSKEEEEDENEIKENITKIKPKRRNQDKKTINDKS